jgi:hypothetical protein
VWSEALVIMGERARVQGAGFMVQSLKCRVWNLGCRV